MIFFMSFIYGTPPPPVDSTYTNKSAYKDTTNKKYYKFSGWNKSGEFNISSNTSIRGSWDNGNSIDEFSIVTKTGEEQYGKVVYGDCNGGVFVTIISTYAGGVDGSTTCIYSKDGTTWNTTTVSSSKHYWMDIAYGDGYFVMIAKDGYCSYSTNGINWTDYYHTYIDNSTCICYGDKNKLFAVLGSGTMLSYCLSSDLSSKSWNGGSLAGMPTITDMCYGEGIYLAVCNTVNQYYQSNDGISWYANTITMSSGSTSTAYDGCSYLKDYNTGVSRFIFYSTSTTGYLVSTAITASLTWKPVSASVRFIDACNTTTNPKLIMILSGKNVFRIGDVTISSSGDITYTSTPVLYNGGVNYSSFTNVAYGNGIIVITGAIDDNNKDNRYLFAVSSAYPDLNYVD